MLGNRRGWGRLGEYGWENCCCRFSRFLEPSVRAKVASLVEMVSTWSEWCDEGQTVRSGLRGMVVD